LALHIFKGTSYIKGIGVGGTISGLHRPPLTKSTYLFFFYLAIKSVFHYGSKNKLRQNHH
ncbi:MAG: hypothetical protein IKC92_02565, partial [Tidjanibacter sp.]|nr:hypothetical protein [Tidjanibacter sp.]